MIRLLCKTNLGYMAPRDHVPWVTWVPIQGPVREEYYQVELLSTVSKCSTMHQALKLFVDDVITLQQITMIYMKQLPD